MTARNKAYILLIGSAIIWGIAGPVIKFTLQGIGPFVFLSYRLLVSAFVATLYFLFFTKKRNLKPKVSIRLIIYGLLGITFALGFLFIGLDKSTVLEMGLIGAVEPLVIVAAGAILLNEKVSRREKIGAGLAFSGIMLTIFTPVILGEADFVFTGNIFLVLFLLSDASGILLAKEMVREKISPITMTNVAFIVGAATIVPFTIWKTGMNSMITQITTLPLRYHLGVWYMAIASGTIAYYMFIRGTKTVQVGKASLFFYLQPLFSVPLAVLWLGESITPLFIIGAITIAIGVFIAESNRRNKK